MTTLHVQPPWIEMTLVTPPAGALGLSLSVQAGQGALCESIGAGEHFYATLVNASNVRETVKITARTGDSFTLAERGVDGGYLNGTARTSGGYGSWATGDKVYVGWNRKTIEEAVRLVSDLSPVLYYTADQTLSASDAGAIVRVNASATITLPVGSDALQNKSIRVKNSGAWSVVVARQGADVIETLTSVRVPALETVEFTYMGSSYWEVTQAPESEVGDIIYSAAASRRGCVYAYGQELPKTTYAGLYAVCGTLFGAETNGSGGVGTTHFRAPDLRGRVAAGQDNMGGVAASRITSAQCGINGAILGAAGGNEQYHGHQHTGTTGVESAGHAHSGVTGDQNANHVHTFPGGSAVISSGQTAGQEGALQTATGYTYAGNTNIENAAHQHAFTTGGVSANHTHAFTTALAGGGGSQNVQPTLVLSAFVKL